MNSADIFRSNMDASEYKSYLLGLIFYKYLSDSQLEYVWELLEVEDGKDLSYLLSTYRDFYESEDADDLITELEFKFSYAIWPYLTFTAIIEEIDNKKRNGNNSSRIMHRPCPHATWNPSQIQRFRNNGIFDRHANSKPPPK